MSRKVNNKGRNTGGASYIQLHKWFLESPAWRSLNVYSRNLYIEIKRRYNGRNNGAISMSHREAEQYLGCSKTPIPAAFNDLQAKGFIRPQQKGVFKGIPTATTWILTELPQDEPQKHLAASKDFMSWKPSNDNPVKKKQPPLLSGLPAHSKGVASKEAAHSKGADNPLRMDCEGVFSDIHSPLKMGTYNIPYTDGGPDAGTVTVDNTVQAPDLTVTGAHDEPALPSSKAPLSSSKSPEKKMDDEPLSIPATAEEGWTVIDHVALDLDHVIRLDMHKRLMHGNLRPSFIRLRIQNRDVRKEVI